MPKAGLYRWVVDGLTMFVVSALSLSLLLYVAYREGYRGYEQIHLEKITSQGRLVQSSIEKYLRADLPLRQYAGFATLATPIVEGDDLDGMAVYEHAGRQIFVAVNKTNRTLPPPPSAVSRVQ